MRLDIADAEMRRCCRLAVCVRASVRGGGVAVHSNTIAANCCPCRAMCIYNNVLCIAKSVVWRLINAVGCVVVYSKYPSWTICMISGTPDSCW